MQSRTEYPPGVPCWIDLATPDADAAAHFYGGVFGWEFSARASPGEPESEVVAALDGRLVAGIRAPTAASTPPGWTTFIAVADADDAVARVIAAGGQVRAAPSAVAGAGRRAVCADPAGAVFGVSQGQGRAGAELVNAPGSWNWSNLATPDTEEARAFYGTVFGWVADPVAGGSGAATMWRLPGYGDFLARFDPDMRRRQDAAGVPAGFADAIGWVSETTETTAGNADPPDGIAQGWSVTFAVDDTDGVAQRAVTLGGTVLVAPFAAGPARIAVLRDPNGAAFTVSHYQPGS